VQAVAQPSVYPAPSPRQLPAGETGVYGVEIGSDGRTLTVFPSGGWPMGSGPCQAEYTLWMASSATAVALVVDETMNPRWGDVVCAVQFHPIELTTVLAEPLGARVIAGADAQPIEVTARGATG